MPEPKSQIWPGIHVQFAAFRSSIISTSKKLQAKKRPATISHTTKSGRLYMPSTSGNLMSLIVIYKQDT